MKTSRAAKRGKKIEDVVTYALSHRTRIRVLTLLNEGVYTPDEMGEILGEDTERISYHVRELVEGGSIELVKVEKVRNADQHYYRAVEMPYFTDEEAAAMTPQERQVIAGLTLQNIIAESLAALHAGKLHDDPSVVELAWRWFNFDRKAREDLASEQLHWWGRVSEIEAESLNRCAKSGEQPESIVVAHMGFPRERTAPRPPGKR
jgi:DNA-binding transcriptional ArsR family regulator